MLQKDSIHANLASHWFPSPAIKYETKCIIESLQQTIDLELANTVSMESESATAATLLSDALEREDRDDLRILSSTLAISRGETNIARKLASDRRKARIVGKLISHVLVWMGMILSVLGSRDCF